MATTIANTSIRFFDNMPGIFYPGVHPVADATGALLTNAAEHNVSTAIVPKGSKVRLKDPTTAEYATFWYGQVGTQSAIAAADLVGMEVSSSLYTGKVTDLASAVDLGGPSCVALSAMTDEYWGWFFCGGRVPIGLVPGLDTTFITNDSVAANKGMMLISDTVLKLGVADGTLLTLGSACAGD